MHWCRQLFCPSGPSKVLGFSDGPDLAQTPSLQHAGGVARGAPCAARRGLRAGIGGPVHTSPWDGMGWGARAPFPLGWDGMGWGPCVRTSPWDGMGWGLHAHFPLGWDGMGCDGGPVHTSLWDGMGWGAPCTLPPGMGWDGMGWGAQCTLPLDRLFFRIRSLSPAAHLATGLPLIALEIMSTWLIPSFSAS